MGKRFRKVISQKIPHPPSSSYPPSHMIELPSFVCLYHQVTTSKPWISLVPRHTPKKRLGIVLGLNGYKISPLYLLDHSTNPLYLFDDSTNPLYLLDHSTNPLYLLDHSTNPLYLLDHSTNPLHLLDHSTNPLYLLDDTH